ncbi:two-component system LytT family response regulator [Pedobacter sp. CG_S7]|uniref:LytR/AlgR family response regulator transcription factor n=1 Tax=Pedobacter sp. CG_S7 TaxID=3143930 RepID=UPI00339AA119
MLVLNAIIVDDEEFARSSLYFLLQENCENIQISGIAKSVTEARKLLAENKIDLIFLDIAMPGENGFELIPAAVQNNAHVVFTTAYDQYALKAIKANALDYLLKPIDIDELKETVIKATKYIGQNKLSAQQMNSQLTQLAENLADRSEIRKLNLPNGQGGYTLVNFNQIIHVEADSNYSVFHLSGMEKITVAKVLKEYEEILPENKFVRVHKSSIINLDYLKEYNSKNGLEVVLKSGVKIAVSRRRASEFAEKVKTYTNFRSDE